MPPGIALAFCPPNSSRLYVGTVVLKKRKGIGMVKTAAKLGREMTNVVETAHAVARAMLQEKRPENKFFEDSKLQIDVDSGASPCASCAMITSMLSLALNTAVKNDLAMAGEVTEDGRVLGTNNVSLLDDF